MSRRPKFLGVVLGVLAVAVVVVVLSDSGPGNPAERLSSDLGGCSHRLDLPSSTLGLTPYVSARTAAAYGVTDLCGPGLAGATGTYVLFKSHAAMQEALNRVPRLTRSGACISQRELFNNNDIGREFPQLCHRAGFRIISLDPADRNPNTRCKGFDYMVQRPQPELKRGGLVADVNVYGDKRICRLRTTFRLVIRSTDGSPMKSIHGNPALLLVNEQLTRGAAVSRHWAWQNWCPTPSGRFKVVATAGQQHASIAAPQPPPCKSRREPSTLGRAPKSDR